jgi:hypothetical protein
MDSHSYVDAPKAMDSPFRMPVITSEITQISAGPWRMRRRISAPAVVGQSVYDSAKTGGAWKLADHQLRRRSDQTHQRVVRIKVIYVLRGNQLVLHKYCGRGRLAFNDIERQPDELRAILFGKISD